MDIELMKAAVTLEGVLSGTSALALFAEVEALTAENTRIIAMVDAREQTIAELTALCDGHRGEVERSKSLVASLREDLRHTEEHAQAAITRARAEGMEFGAVKVDELKAILDDLSLHSPHALEDNAFGRAAYEAELTAATIRGAAKGER